jgi:hypothetical protein
LSKTSQNFASSILLSFFSSGWLSLCQLNNNSALSTIMFVFYFWLVLVWYGGVTLVQSDELKFDERRHLAQNAILYQNTTHCRDKITHIWRENNGYSNARDLVALQESELAKFYEANKDLAAAAAVSASTCLAVCVNEGTAKEHLYHPLPFLTYSEQMPFPPTAAAITADRHQLLDWNYQCRIAEVSVISFSPEPLTLVWVDLMNPGW